MVHRRLQSLIALLALRGATPRVRLGQTLWPTSSEDRAANSLRVALWQVSHSLPELLADVRDPIALHPAVMVDVHELSRAIDRTELGPDPIRHVDFVQLQEAEILPDWYDEWILPKQLRFRDRRIHALECLAAAYLAEGNHGRALDCAHAAAELDPLRESSHQLLIECHIDAGNYVIARRAFETFRDRMRQEMNVEPSRQMRRRLDSLRFMQS